MYQLITPPSLALAGLRAAVMQDVPNLSFVFDPALTWETTAAQQRAQRDAGQGVAEAPAVPDQSTAAQPSQFPILAWSRGALRPNDQLGRRAARPSYANVPLPIPSGAPAPPGYTTWDVRAMIAQMAISFRLFARDALELEALELGYGARAIISEIRGFTIPVDTLFPLVAPESLPDDLWRFEVVWNPLDDVQYGTTPYDVCSIGGTADLSGVFLTGQATPVGFVNTIALSILNENTGGLIEEIIVHR